MLTAITPEQWVSLIIGALGIGVSKAGFPGISMLHVVLYASVFGAFESTGILLPMLVVGDLCAIHFFGREANWRHVRRLLPPTVAGILVGWLIMDRLDEGQFKLLVGGIILTLTGVQLVRTYRPGWFDGVPQQTWFALVLGLLAGVTTMTANAAGPVVGLYLLAVALPKWELIGTSAWFFLVLNVLKLPLSFQLDLIGWDTLLIGAVLAPTIPLGIISGRWLVGRVSQKWFNLILLGFTAIAAIRLIGWI